MTKDAETCRAEAARDRRSRAKGSREIGSIERRATREGAYAHPRIRTSAPEEGDERCGACRQTNASEAESNVALFTAPIY